MLHAGSRGSQNAIAQISYCDGWCSIAVTSVSHTATLSHTSLLDAPPKQEEIETYDLFEAEVAYEYT